MSNKKIANAVFIFSTLASDVAYTTYAKGPNDMPVPERDILIKGGAGVANDRILTPRGVMTAIDANDLVALQGNSVFQLHQKNGFVTISDKEDDPDVIAANMSASDESRQLTADDFEEKPDGSDAVEAAAAKPKSRK